MAIKSHFKFSNSQRNGIFLLAILIVVAQAVYFFVDFSPNVSHTKHEEIEYFRQQVDSLKQIASEKNIPKVYPFNPNFITDYKGYTLGMTPEEIDRLLAFRAKDQWINSAQQFQDVTKVSDSMLTVLSPLFKFPDWVTNPKPKAHWVDYSKTQDQKNYASKTYAQKQDLNTATALDLQKINGIGEKISDNIIKYRNKFKGGFISEVQLQDIYGLTPEVISRLLNDFAVKTPRVVEKIDLNSASKEQLVTVQHIDYEIAHHIIEQRTLREGFKSFDELLLVKKFPVQKFEIITLYLKLN
ncbi:helix-hairpin-helix domain-containing protein [Gelidibacter salicanalis]|uniref:Helix-hairpin-helix domain-containing protein n=1 Tax=Gelidibacter salicanalis TaxID=291193 RepID=A0A5C7AUH2_9FLAO|nr:helix-hairpin-helix domain-containing protein [Gelidibacter salicanalis]TXE09412.1 helix-hairpin-helix domain-containing protein [Gelidibacter salicanalis]